MPTVTVLGLEIPFPFEPYRVQLAYMEGVVRALESSKHALLESPTGTGKTLCLLCASLAWHARERERFESRKRMGVADARGEARVGPVVFTSRTHSQLSQAVGELKQTAFATVRAVVLGSREQMCVHERVSKLRGGAQNHQCRSLNAARGCHYRNNVEAHVRDGGTFGTGEVMDIEDAVKHGREHAACPYYVSREEAQRDPDIVFMPYNYVLDQSLRTQTDVSLAQAVLIFDEAHNVERLVSESSSIELSAAELASAISETQRLITAHAEGGSVAAEMDVERGVLLRLKEVLLSLEREINQVPLAPDGSGFARDGLYIFQMFEKFGITYNNRTDVLELVDRVVDALMGMMAEAREFRNTVGLKAFAEFMRALFRGSAESAALRSKHYRTFIGEDKPPGGGGGGNAPRPRKPAGLFGGMGGGGGGGGDGGDVVEGGGGGRKLCYWCFGGGESMMQLSLAGVRTMILTSGTLSPMASFRHELVVRLDVELENPHVIRSDQVLVQVVKRGPMGARLDSSYANRSRPEYKDDLGSALVNFSRCVPGGVLVFFPSYAAMSSCVEWWRRPGAGGKASVMERIGQHKLVVVEPRRSSELKKVVDEYERALAGGHAGGAMMVAVCRGKVSEGLDFSDSSGRAVILTGLPFPALKDPKVVLKQRYLDEMRAKNRDQGGRLSGGEWYKQQAARAINQAVGRVIRHIGDYGAILLLDERFAQESNRRQLSKWIRPHVKVSDTCGPAIGELTRFFKRCQRRYPGRPAGSRASVGVPAAPGQRRPASLSSSSSSSSLSAQGSRSVEVWRARRKEKLERARAHRVAEADDAAEEPPPPPPPPPPAAAESLQSSYASLARAPKPAPSRPAPAASLGSVLGRAALRGAVQRPSPTPLSGRVSLASRIAQRRGGSGGKPAPAVCDEDRDVPPPTTTTPTPKQQALLFAQRGRAAPTEAEGRAPAQKRAAPSSEARPAKRARTAAYLAAVREALPPDLYGRFTAALGRFKSLKNEAAEAAAYRPVSADACALFSDAGRRDLCEALADFVPAAARQGFAECVSRTNWRSSSSSSASSSRSAASAPSRSSEGPAAFLRRVTEALSPELYVKFKGVLHTLQTLKRQSAGRKGRLDDQAFAGAMRTLDEVFPRRDERLAELRDQLSAYVPRPYLALYERHERSSPYHAVAVARDVLMPHQFATFGDCVRQLDRMSGAGGLDEAAAEAVMRRLRAAVLPGTSGGGTNLADRRSLCLLLHDCLPPAFRDAFARVADLARYRVDVRVADAVDARARR